MKNNKDVMLRYCQGDPQTQLDLFLEHRAMRRIFDKIEKKRGKRKGPVEPLPPVQNDVGVHVPKRGVIRSCIALFSLL
jgi:hypothetical protein